jgi:hypothetical protein
MFFERTEDETQSLITERQKFSLRVQLEYAGTVNVDGLKLSRAYSDSKFERLPYRDKIILCHSCTLAECLDIVGPKTKLKILQIPDTDVLLAFSATEPAQFVAVATRHNT